MSPFFSILATSLLIASTPPSLAAAPEISTAKLSALQTDLRRQNVSRASTTSKRRAYKNIVRDAKELLLASPEAPNRFELLALTLHAQKRLVALDNTEQTRETLFEICCQLAEAPDNHAALRLEADFFLSERSLAQKNADLKQRATALAALIQKYRGTPGEAKCLMMAHAIAPKLDALELELAILAAMSERFQGDHAMINFRRKHTKTGKLDVLFSGTFNTSRGSTLSFPMDRMGHTSLLYFWSKETPELAERIAEAKALQTRFSDQFQVYSFNLDELPDAGASILRELKADWTPVYLSEGRNSAIYQVYVAQDPGAVLVNAHGHALLTSSAQHSGILPLIPRQAELDAHAKLGMVDKVTMASSAPTLEESLDNGRTLAQLQSLFIGDFLVTQPTPASSTIPGSTLAPIHAQFIPAPFRYRLSTKDALGHYSKVNDLCKAALDLHSKSSDRWRIYNPQIIALLGMWNLSTEPKHLASAVQAAQSSLALKPPAHARVIPEFCLAKDALRRGTQKPAAVLAHFIDQTSGDTFGSALAAAALLSMDANDRDLHAKYRHQLLDSYRDDTTLLPVTTFLRDRQHHFRNFRATHSRFGFIRAERHAIYRNTGALDTPLGTPQIMRGGFTTPEGQTLSFPQAAHDKLTFLTFLELPDSEETAKHQNQMIKRLSTLADSHEPKGVQVVAAFLTSDTKRISALVTTNEWTCQVVTVPDGLKNPLVQQYGILSADRIPNIFLLRPDSTIAWRNFGVIWPVQASSMATALSYAIDANLHTLQAQTAKTALDNGEFETAIRLFSEAVRPRRARDDWWSTFRHYGTARAHVGLKDWDSALTNITSAINTHTVFGWGKPVHCTLVVEMELAKADILDKLGRKPEAATERKKAKKPTRERNPTPFGLYGDYLETFRLNPHSGK